MFRTSILQDTLNLIYRNTTIIKYHNPPFQIKKNKEPRMAITDKRNQLFTEQYSKKGLKKIILTHTCIVWVSCGRKRIQLGHHQRGVGVGEIYIFVFIMTGQCRQEAKWEICGKGAGSGKVHQSGLELGMPLLQWRYMSAQRVQYWFEHWRS